VLHAAAWAGMPVKIGRGPLLPSHEATTAQLGAAYPFAATRPLPAERVLVGGDLAGGPFRHDPFDLYAAGVITNPNMTVLGQIGRGKSALVKSYLYREAAFGRRLAVLDPKGEYAPLARALGVRPIKLSPRGGVRINPLEAVARSSPESAAESAETAAETRRSRLTLLGALSEATMRRRLSPVERLALEVALDSCVGEPTLAEVVERLLEPDLDARAPSGIGGSGIGGSGIGGAVFATDGRDVGLELRRLVRGDLAGMFDGQSTSTSSTAAAAHALVVDLSEAYHSEALPAIMVCAAAWLQSMTAATNQAASQPKTLFVVDEAWAVLSDVAVGRYLRSSWKLARARGLANVAVCHRASDLAAAGALGSEEARLAEGLLADSETVVCYAQPSSELPVLAGLLGCSIGEIEYLPTLRRGVALWRVGGKRFLVEHMLSTTERVLVDTDERL
jgi:type IV secretory pathway VirB4 component